MSLAGLRVAIVGAGVAGLASAAAMAVRGAEVIVLERSPEIGQVGAGIQISPNGMTVLAALGLRERALAAGLQSEAVVLHREDGRRVLTMDLRRHGGGRDWILIHRARLIGLLADAARSAGAAISLGHEVTEVVDSAQPRVMLADGREVSAGVVVGADGFRSRCRAAVGEAAEPAFMGQVAWRAVLPDEGGPPVAQVFMGGGRHLVTYPLRGGLRNVVAVEERDIWASDDWSAAGDPAELRAAFAAFAPEVRDLLARVPEANLWGLFRTPVAQRFHGQRVALAGDAAHPTLPFLAQGANLALEDAFALAVCLDRAAPDIALPEYTRRRRERTARVVAAATRNARNYHLKPGPLRWAAHLALGAADRLSPASVLGRFEWLYGHDETA
ncbi:FAD-dependent oxidoreductase [Roseitranquillus sediminis]|uniref:FAD-dependent oxidoreductase n=1 Tax=Roseitranquillus sediminis TaxID=2809051 RepID=UPI001D0C1560|nr:FAD-dependent monooxygenase [Roseitranquillus sediminis]MBM9594132.1 FAD-dependent monooxygenase [Roseitranquillus sediminis]